MRKVHSVVVPVVPGRKPRLAWEAVVQLPGDSRLALEVAVPPGAVAGLGAPL